MARIDRFRTAQDAPHSGFDAALQEIRGGGKRGHWIWYIFPQLSSLGRSSMSRSFGIADGNEAMEFLRDPKLRARYLTISTAVADQLRAGAGVSLATLMGSTIDAQKLVSSLTLFGNVAAQMDPAGTDEALTAIARVANEVLAIAAKQGYPPCAATLGALQRK